MWADVRTISRLLHLNRLQSFLTPDWSTLQLCIQSQLRWKSCFLTTPPGAAIWTSAAVKNSPYFLYSSGCNYQGFQTLVTIPSTTEARRRPHQPHASLHQEPDHFLPELCVQGIEVDHLLLRLTHNPMLVVGNRRGYIGVFLPFNDFALWYRTRFVYTTI